MKKKVLLSVFAAALVAAPAVSARDLEGHVGDAPIFKAPTEADLNNPNYIGELTDKGQDLYNKSFEKSTQDKFKAAKEDLVPKKDENGKVIPGQFVVKGNAKAPAKKPAGQKTLPKTHAVK